MVGFRKKTFTFLSEDKERKYKHFYFSKNVVGKLVGKYCFECKTEIINEAHTRLGNGYDKNADGSYHDFIICCACNSRDKCIESTEKEVEKINERIKALQKDIQTLTLTIHLTNNKGGAKSKLIDKQFYLTNYQNKLAPKQEYLQRWKSLYEEKYRYNFYWNVRVENVSDKFWLTPAGYLEKGANDLLVLENNQEKDWNGVKVKINKKSFFLDGKEFPLKKIKGVYFQWDLDFGLDLDEQSFIKFFEAGRDFWEEWDDDKQELNFRAWQLSLQAKGVEKEHFARNTLKEGINNNSDKRNLVARMMDRFKDVPSEEGAKVVDYCPSCQTWLLRTYCGRLVVNNKEDWRCWVCERHYFPDEDIRFGIFEKLFGGKNQEELKKRGIEVKTGF